MYIRGWLGSAIIKRLQVAVHIYIRSGALYIDAIASQASQFSWSSSGINNRLYRLPANTEESHWTWQRLLIYTPYGQSLIIIFEILQLNIALTCNGQQQRCTLQIHLDLQGFAPLPIVTLSERVIHDNTCVVRTLVR